MNAIELINKLQTYIDEGKLNLNSDIKSEFGTKPVNICSVQLCVNKSTGQPFVFLRLSKEDILVRMRKEAEEDPKTFMAMFECAKEQRERKQREEAAS